MLCEKVVEFRCPDKHIQKRKCHKSQPQVCHQCIADDERRQREQEAALERQNRRDEARRKHAAEMAKLEEQIRLIRERTADNREAEERAQALEQKKRELESTQQTAKSAQSKNTASNGMVSATKSQDTASPVSASKHQPPRPNREQSGSLKTCVPETDGKTPSELEWERQKRVGNASNDAIDALMGLTGLEDVKSKFLGIKAKIETISRQGGSLKRERLGVVMLGNPGTGKFLISLKFPAPTAK
jgi:hypothetical protein